MKKLFFGLVLAIMPGICSAQTIQMAFDNAYWASQPVEVQALRGATNVDLAVTLAEQGVPIDNVLMIWQWDPYLIMQARAAMGMTWVPSLLQNPLGCTNPRQGTVCYALPGVPPGPTQSAYPKVGPPGSIPVVTSIEQLPAAKEKE